MSSPLCFLKELDFLLSDLMVCSGRILIWIYLLTAIGLTPGSSSTVHIYTQTIHRITQLTTLVGRLSANTIGALYPTYLIN